MSEFGGDHRIFDGGAWIGIGCGLMAAFIVQKYQNRVSVEDDKYDPSHMSKVMSPLLQSQLVPLLEHQRELAIVNAIIRMTRPAPFQLLKFCWRPVVYLTGGACNGWLPDNRG